MWRGCGGRLHLTNVIVSQECATCGIVVAARVDQYAIEVNTEIGVLLDANLLSVWRAKAFTVKHVEWVCKPRVPLDFV